MCAKFVNLTASMSECMCACVCMRASVLMCARRGRVTISMCGMCAEFVYLTVNMCVCVCV